MQFCLWIVWMLDLLSFTFLQVTIFTIWRVFVKICTDFWSRMKYKKVIYLTIISYSVGLPIFVYWRLKLNPHYRRRVREKEPKAIDFYYKFRDFISYGKHLGSIERLEDDRMMNLVEEDWSVFLPSTGETRTMFISTIFLLFTKENSNISFS